MGGRTKLIAISVLIAGILYLLVPPRAILKLRLLILEATTVAKMFLQNKPAHIPSSIGTEDISKLVAENNKLKEAIFLQGFINNRLAEKYTYSHSEIIKSLKPTENAIIIKIGNIPIKEGDAVTVNNCLVGIVDQVYDKFAKVLLTIHPKFKCAVYMFNGEKRIRGICKAQGSKLVLRIAIQSVKVPPYSPIYTATSELANFPEDLVIGEVEYTKPLKTGEFEIVITPSISTDSLQTLLIVSKK